jgi:hypothetical protein
MENKLAGKCPCNDCEPRMKKHCGGNCIALAQWSCGCEERLASYEDTGLEPEEIEKLKTERDFARFSLSKMFTELVPHWIPCSEELPKEWENEDGDPIQFNVMIPGAKEATTLCFNGSQWFGFDWKNMSVVGYYTVTHWQPLPQPPKGEKP